jgi:hypothetical protein
MITSTTSPDTWDEVGGAGSLAEFDSAGALVITQTRKVHEEIEWLLRSVRAARDAQSLPVYDARSALEQHRRRSYEYYQEERAMRREQQQAHLRTRPQPTAQPPVSAGPVAVRPWQLPRHHE